MINQKIKKRKQQELTKVNEVVICLNPEGKEFRSLMEKISSDLESEKALIFPPHITIVHRIHTEFLGDLINSLKKEVQSISPFEIQFEKIKFFEESSIVFLDPISKKEIKKLHKIFLPIATKFKDGWFRNSFLKLNNSTIQKTYLNKFGSPFVEEFFNAHLTLAGPDINRDKFNKFNSETPEFNIPKMTVNNINVMCKTENGWKIVERIPLKVSN